MSLASCLPNYYDYGGINCTFVPYGILVHYPTSSFTDGIFGPDRIRTGLATEWVIPQYKTYTNVEVQFLTTDSVYDVVYVQGVDFFYFDSNKLPAVSNT